MTIPLVPSLIIAAVFIAWAAIELYLQDRRLVQIERLARRLDVWRLRRTVRPLGALTLEERMTAVEGRQLLQQELAKAAANHAPAPSQPVAPTKEDRIAHYRGQIQAARSTEHYLRPLVDGGHPLALQALNQLTIEAAHAREQLRNLGVEA